MTKVALYCLDVVGKSMAGPAIRYWEFAKALSKKYEVTLLTPNQPDIFSDDFQIVPHYNKLNFNVMKEMNVVVAQSISCFLAYQAKKHGIKLILDAYDPLPLEILEIYKQLPLKEREMRSRRALEEHLFSFQMADGFICASEKQKDLWMGSLLTLNRINPRKYDADPSLNQLIGVVPFGLSSEEPVITGKGLRDLFNLSKTDKVILWGGGIWNWFDPLTLIKAVKLLSHHRDDVKLVFMGLKHPNDRIPEMEMSRQAVQLAKDLNLIDKHVFFNFGWVPYEERQNFLLDADIGVSTHLDHLETRYSFRTRMLDYIWAGLPIIGTVGDSFAELIQSHQLGIAVPYNDSQAIADAIERIVDDKTLSLAMKANLEKMRRNFYWQHVVHPLEHLIEHLAGASSLGLDYKELSSIVVTLTRKMNQIRQDKGFSGMLSAIVSRLSSAKK